MNALQEHLASLVVQQPGTGFEVLQQPSAQTRELGQTEHDHHQPPLARSGRAW